MSAADELAKLAELLEKGLITDEEFKAQKEQLLGTSAPPATEQAADSPAPAASAAPAADSPSPASGGQASVKPGPKKEPKGLSGGAIAAIVGGGILAVVLVVVLIFVLKDDTGGGMFGRAKTSEAVDQLDKIYKGAAVYYSTPFISDEGQKLPCQFPANQGVTPVEGTCCSTGGLGGPDSNQDDRCDTNPAVWDEVTWSELNFQMNDEHYFVYAFDSEGTLNEASFYATANADLDCDSIQSTFQRIAFGDEQANFAECALHGAPAMFVDQETE